LRTSSSEQVEALASHQAIGVVEAVLVGLAGADEVHLELNGDDAERIEAFVEGLQDFEVGAVDVDLEVIEIGPAAFGEQGAKARSACADLPSRSSPTHCGAASPRSKHP